MRDLALVINMAFRFQPLGIGKGDAGESATKPAGVDAQDDVPGIIIVIILAIKLFGNIHRLRMLPKRVHDADTSWQRCPGVLQLLVKLNNLIGE